MDKKTKLSKFIDALMLIMGKNYYCKTTIEDLSNDLDIDRKELIDLFKTQLIHVEEEELNLLEKDCLLNALKDSKNRKNVEANFIGEIILDWIQEKKGKPSPLKTMTCGIKRLLKDMNIWK
jgi:hypothetical protein